VPNYRKSLLTGAFSYETPMRGPFHLQGREKGTFGLGFS
jgi:hypothetical protein